jgi:hypothetical protein
MRCLILAVAGLLSSAAFVVADDQRVIWVYEAGWYQQKDGKNWIEVNPDNYPEAKALQYVEVKRTEQYVELYDDSRKIVVRLFDSTEEHRVGDGKWETGYKGRWRK